ncbi:MAG: hypothetical protein INR71_05835 [Terriglobus roseus]|nr:hypothetical protein [Terriglobus roseus]
MSAWLREVDQSASCSPPRLKRSAADAFGTPRRALAERSPNLISMAEGGRPSKRVRTPSPDKGGLQNLPASEDDTLANEETPRPRLPPSHPLALGSSALGLGGPANPIPSFVGALNQQTPPQQRVSRTWSSASASASDVSQSSVRSSTNSKRSRASSPTKRMFQLQEVGDGIECGTLDDGASALAGSIGGRLHKALELPAMGHHILPLAVKTDPVLREALGVGEEHDFKFDEGDLRSAETFAREVKEVRRIVKKTGGYTRAFALESQWNSAVHGCALQQALGGANVRAEYL